MLPERIVLVARDRRLAAAFREVFRDESAIVVREGDLFDVHADAMLSPANSFGIMDGGIDAAIRDAIAGIEPRVRGAIEARHHGELPVGVAEIVATDDDRWPHLVVAPTMRVPDDVSRTTNAYLAFRAALLAIRAHNARGGTAIRSLVSPGLCTGIGAMPARRCAAQMRIAWRQVTSPTEPPSFDAIYATHRAMRTVE
jgi:O-acetyl-ADP-ribose deacetylase (regulator of RNase III)